MTRVRRLLIASILLGGTSPAAAQQQEPARASAEGVASISMFSDWSQPTVILDGTAAVRIGGGTVGLIRPWIWKRPDGSWTSEWYQLQIRYKSDTRIPFRVDAGIVPSPLGLATLEARPDLNPTVSPPFYYFVPLPRFDTTFDGVQMMSGGYPFGAIVSTSGTRWDVRGGVTSGTPARSRAELKADQPHAMPQLILGGGVSPFAGLRIGAGFAHGRYRDARAQPLGAGADYSVGTVPTSAAIAGAARATVANLEAEYAFGHTRLKAEWIRDRFETTTTPVAATAFFVQGTHTFTPRWFGAARLTSVDAPLAPVSAMTRSRASVGEAIAGYRLTPELTLRGGYYTERYYRAPSWDKELCMSIVWAGRWR
jgi:hypothetical protein